MIPIEPGERDRLFRQRCEDFEQRFLALWREQDNSAAPFFGALLALANVAPVIVDAEPALRPSLHHAAAAFATHVAFVCHDPDVRH